MILFVNNFSAITTTDALSTAGTRLTLQDIEIQKLDAVELNKPDNFYIATMSNGSNLEIVHIVSIDDCVCTLERGKEGTTPLEFAPGSRIEIRVTAGGLSTMVQKSDVLNEEDMASNDPQRPPSQSSVKKYIQSKIPPTYGDVTGPGETTINYVPLWSSGDKTLGNGKPAPSGDFVGTSDPQTLSGKKIIRPKINEDVELLASSSEINKLALGPYPKKSIILQARHGIPIHDQAVAGTSQPVNDVLTRYLSYGAENPEGAEWSIVLPDNYDSGPIEAQFYWTCAGGGAGEIVTWVIKAQAWTEGEEIDTLWGGAVTISQAWTGDNRWRFTPVTPPITLAGTPGPGNVANFQVYRDVDNDSLACNVLLGYVRLSVGRTW